MKDKRLFKFVVAWMTIVSLLMLTACGSSADAEEQDTGFIEETPSGGTDPEEEAQMPDSSGSQDIPNSTEDPVQPPQEAEAKTVYIRSLITGLNVRSGAGSSYSSVGKLDNGDMTLYLGKEGNWYRTYYRGKTAYISALYSELYEMQSASEATEAVLYIGAKLLGTPYVYGAQRLHYGDGILNKNFNINQFDCSSYTQYMFFYGADVLLNTTTRTQITQGVHVDKKDIQRGDLLFFTNASRYYNTGIERVGHVAVYLGDNYILHTASDFAVIEKISSARWGYFIEARRIPGL
jgi:cell wall-associated NlpC family hydrolase